MSSQQPYGYGRPAYNHHHHHSSMANWRRAKRAATRDPIKWGQLLKRGSTAPDLEQGRGENTTGDAQLSQVNTAPAQSPIAEEARKSKDEDGAQTQQGPPDSQASTADSSIGNGTLRQRKTGISGDDAAKDADVQQPPEKKKTSMFRNPKPKEPFTVRNQLQRTLLNSPINLLLVAIPAGFAVKYAGVDGKAVFAVNFIAIIPLAKFLSDATEEIALRTGEVLGGLINATFGNAVELIVAVEALLNDQVVVVKTSLIGSILSNLLLVLGMCFFCGGWSRKTQHFNQIMAQTAASLLALAIASAIIPTVFDKNDNTNNPDHVADLSHGTAVILLVVYAGYLLFQLRTHHDVTTVPSEKTETTNLWTNKTPSPEHQGVSAMAKMGEHMGFLGGRDSAGNLLAHAETEPHPLEDDDDEEDPQLSIWVAIAQLTISTVLIGFLSEFMVGGIDSITAEGVSEEFVGLILLPIVGNAAEHVTAVTVAIKDKMDMSIGVALGSSMQVSLFLIPLLVIVGWGVGNPDMNLSFDVFQVAVLFVSILLVNYLIADGESNWLEGLLLICLYLIIAVCSWYYPASGAV